MKRLLPLIFLLLSMTAQAQQSTITPNCAGSNDTAAFSTIIAGVGSNTATIRLPFKPGSRCAVNTLTIPANITLDNSDGTGIKVNTGQTLTLVGPVSSPQGKQIFYNALSGQGTVRLTGNKSLSVLPVRWWGALGDGSTDDTDEIQATIDCLDGSNLWGTVLFHSGVYVVGGALQDTGASNAQILLPKRTASQLGIRLKGESPASNLGVDVSTKGAVIKSTLSSGNGALLGVKTAGPLNRSEITLYLEDIVFRTVANPTISALDLRYVMVAMLRDVKVDSGEGYNAVTEPTTAASYGLRMPANNVVSQSHMLNVAIAGFYNGLELNELAGGDRIVVVNCYQAVVVPASFHAIQVTLIELINNTRNFVFTGGLSYLNVALVSIEHPQGAAWYATAADIYDPSSFRRGYIGWHVVEQNVGASNNLLITGTYVAGLVHLDRPVSPLRTYGTDGTEFGVVHAVTGVETLVAGAATITLTGAAAFTDATSYVCTASDTTAANPVKVTRVSGTQFTLTGTGTDVVMFSCFGT